jgi:adenylate kinase
VHLSEETEEKIINVSDDSRQLSRDLNQVLLQYSAAADISESVSNAVIIQGKLVIK